MPERSLEFDLNAFEDLAWWIKQDRKKALRIVELIKEIEREPFTGIGKPEPLKHEFAGCWSRRIDHIESCMKSVLKRSGYLHVAITISGYNR